MQEVIEWVPMGMIAVVAYFLKTLHTDIKKNVSDIGKLKGRVETLSVSSKNEIDKLSEMTNLQIQQLTENVSKLENLVHELIKKQ